MFKPELMYAPWDEGLVTKLEEWQANDKIHSYTCQCGADLIPTINGWKCNKCKYKQIWCHAFHARPVMCTKK